jgi:hypothetical protein
MNDILEIHYRKQEGGYRLWIISTNPLCSMCSELKTVYKPTRREILIAAFGLADYYKENGKRPIIKEIE